MRIYLIKEVRFHIYYIVFGYIVCDGHTIRNLYIDYLFPTSMVSSTMTMSIILDPGSDKKSCMLLL